MLPMAYLKQEGMNPKEKVADEPVIASDNIGYVFAGDDDVVAQWVLNGTVIAGAVDNETFEEFAEGNPGALMILAETEGMIGDTMVLVRPDLDPELQAAVKAVLLAMDDTAEGQAVLKGNKAVNFIEVQGTVEEAWSHTSELYRLISD